MVLRRIFFILLLFPLLTSCQRKGEETASIKIQFPTAQSFGKVGTLSTISAANICYVVNVLGSGITEQNKSCDVKRGITAGSVAPGSELSITVPSGSNRTVEIYGILRNSPSEPCPAAQTNWPVPLTRVYFLGKLNNVEVRPPTTTVDITITLPDSSQNLISQLSLPGSCVASTITEKSGRIFASAELSTSLVNGYKKVSHISFKTEDQIRTSTGGYKIKNTAVEGL